MSCVVAPPALTPASALAAAGVRPRKSRGQNFLVQRRIGERIVKAAEIEPGDAIVEIGPGLGMLTELMLESAARKLTLIELDPRLAALLESRFQGDTRVEVLNRDFLKLTRSQLGAAPVRVIGNLPFNVATAILERLCGYSDAMSRMVLMFQREVAERIRARPGAREYGALSVFTALYWDVREHFRVAAGSFHPRPKVDAEVLVLVPRGEPAFRPAEESAVLATVRAAFSAPRKTIRNSLAGGFSLDRHGAEAVLERAGINPSSRPGMIAAGAFVRLARILEPSARPQGSRDA
jgi:16S rRNA (adenine1518-N6/adenine1519-N6)-dimethyltransferase